nr:RES family NAD+ phosphorylase [Afifella sp. H1R]
MGEECEFDADSHYEEKAIADHEFAFEFRAIERSLKSQARFFNRGAEEFLNRIFADLDGRTAGDGRPVIVTAGPDAKIRGFFRARVFHHSEELDQALVRPDLHLGPPPSRIARAGRMNAHGISVFYGASDPGVALAEVRPPVGSRALVGRFELVCPVRLLDVEALRSVYAEGSIFDPSYVEQLALAKFLGRLSDRITMPVMPDDEPTEYLITQTIADYLARRPEPGLDGILFRSVQRPGEHQNVVLFNHASKVAELEFPEGTELSAHQYDETEDGPESDYWVWEETPPEPEEAADEEEEEEDGFFGLNAMLEPPDFAFSEDADFREDFLRVDTAQVSVHHVKGVTFDVDEFEVRRRRSEKRKLPF